MKRQCEKCENVMNVENMRNVKIKIFGFRISDFFGSIGNCELENFPQSVYIFSSLVFAAFFNFYIIVLCLILKWYNMSKPKKTIIMPVLEKQKGKTKQKTSFALLIDVRKTDDAPFKIKGLIVHGSNGERSLKPVLLNSTHSLYQLSHIPHTLGWILHSFTQEKLDNEKNNLQLDADIKNIRGVDKENFVRKGLLKNQHEAFQKLKPLASLVKWYYQFVDEQLLTTAVIKPAAISDYLPKLSFELVKTNSGILRLIAWININNQSFKLTEFKRHGFLLQSKNEFFLLDPKDAETLENFPDGFSDAPDNNMQLFMQQTVIPLAENYEVRKDAILKKETITTPPKCRVYLNELNNSFLMITAKWQYADIELEDDVKGEIISITTEDTVYEIQRDVDAEKEIKSFLRSMHNRFVQQNNGYFYLPFAEAEKSQWFVKFYRKLADNNVPVYGMEHLKHFRYNINIPDEWINKYSLLLKLGDIDKDKLRLSKLHWTLTQELSEAEGITNRIITEDYKTKWKRLQEQSDSLYKIPKTINAQLRDYQKAGFEWMCLLDEMQWGGCLADDMGLGKTLQAITFLQYVTGKNKKETHLV